MNAIFKTTLLTSTLLLAGSAWACGMEPCKGSECNKDGVYFKGIYNNTAISQDQKVEMDLHGMKVHKAGDLVEGTGHFHIIIDGAFVKKGAVVPKDATHLHYGKGQTETTLKLTPGDHTLTLQLADGHHVSYGEPWSRTVKVYVKP